MKQEGPCVGSHGRFELPNHFAIFRLILKGPKSLSRVLVDVKSWVAHKTFIGELCTLDSLRNVIAERAFGIGFEL